MALGPANVPAISSSSSAGRAAGASRNSNSSNTMAQGDTAPDSRGSLLFPLQFTYADEGAEVRIRQAWSVDSLHCGCLSSTHPQPSITFFSVSALPQRLLDAPPAQYDPAVELGKINSIFASLSDAEQEVRKSFGGGAERSAVAAAGGAKENIACAVCS